jgi:hypothetical protein
MVSFIEVNGARLAYEISSDDATKPLLITLHGGRGFGMLQKYSHSGWINKDRQVAMEETIEPICR